LQPVDERCRFVASELASGLSLRETHGAARVSEVRVTGVLQ
jgi:hypothetical protein